MNGLNIPMRKTIFLNLFTFEEYAHLNMENTTNRLEGLFKELKQKLSVYNRLTKKHKIMFIKDFLNKKSW